MLFKIHRCRFNRSSGLMVLPACLLTVLALLFTLGHSRADHGAPPPNQNSPLGTNLIRVSDFSGDWPFVDAFKASRPWIALRNGQTVTGTLDGVTVRILGGEARSSWRKGILTGATTI
ncbi:MAG: hypothetical protein R3E79_02240 [Caldilineaceae bacterium]